MNKLELQKTANEIRKGIVSGVHAAKAGHPGGSLSAADIFTYLYFEEMNVDPKNPKDPDRDRFVLSKGHTAPGLYAALAENQWRIPQYWNCIGRGTNRPSQRHKRATENTAIVLLIISCMTEKIPKNV